jgi:lipopolysaccharide/colanic/teichoic acid biosynthesis glycosyltransferase
VFYVHLKRPIELAAVFTFGLPICIILFPFMILIVVQDGLPLLYRARRTGLYSNEFRMLKLRSMYKENNDERYSTQTNDPRIMPIGRAIRKYSLDELPQLINIMRGEMSFIGPRPDDPRMKELYSDAEWNKRNKVRPGITGLAQVINRHSLTVRQRKRLDLFYVDKHCFKLDAYIFFKTLKVLLFRRSF